MTIADILKSTPKRKRNDALWLLEFILKKNRSELLLDAERSLTPGERIKWTVASLARKTGKPLQYIVGSAPFWGREFRVGRGVLIPRPETEMLVELALNLFSKEEAISALDIGTGSGAVAITLKLERPGWKITGTDISAKALKYAKENAKILDADVELARADLFASKLRKKNWSLVVSNPPYLDTRKDKITAEVRDWEPRSALEPAVKEKSKEVKERAAWCAENILRGCAAAKPRYTALELSARVAKLLETRWRKHESVARIWREADLAGKKRFLLVAWKQDA